jgi:hypothetical protein
MDIEVILDTAESEAPGLRELARRFLEAEAAHFGMPLDLASVMARRAEGEPELHISGAGRRARQVPGCRQGGPAQRR